MFSKLAILNFLRKHSLNMLIIGAIAFVAYEMVTLSSDLSETQTELRTVEMENAQLVAQMDMLNRRIQEDLTNQREIRERIETSNEKLRMRVESVVNTLQRNPSDQPRDYRRLMDARPNLLENIFNDGTKEIADEIQNIGRD